MPAPSRWRLLLSTLLLACATPSDESHRPVDLVLDPSLVRGSDARRSAWMVYGVGRAVFSDELKPQRKNPAEDDYLIEVRARAKLAEYWRDQRAGSSAPADPYLDELVAIAGRGEIEEHVLVSLAKPGWTVPASDLAQLDFAALARPELRELEAPILAWPEPVSGKQWSDLPGSTLPDPLSLHPNQVPCTESLPALRQAIRAWEQELERLDGAPAAAEDRQEFLRLLAESHGEPPFVTRGAAWVSPKPLWLSFEAGFCAIEHERFAEAKSYLESALRMAPHADPVRMELVHVLLSMHELDRADSLLDYTLSHANDRCFLARAWRKRGYIRYEQRRLDDARDAYLKSLEYDPNSSLARSELDLLARAIEQNGGRPEWYVAPESRTSISECPEL